MKLVQKTPPAKPDPKAPRALRTLADFGLTAEAIAAFVKGAHGERARLGPFFPKNARGTTFYFWFVALLRRFLVTKRVGWEEHTEHGLELVQHAEKKIRIGYVSADAATGTADEPKSRKRGKASIVVAARNAQMVLPFDPRFLGVRAKGDYETWFVLVHRATEGYRLELGLPVEVRERRFAGWQQRISIGDVPLDTEPMLDNVEPPPPQTPPMPKRRGRKTSEAEAARPTGTK